MKSKEEVLNTLETIIKNKKEAKEIWSKLQEDSKISEKSWDLSSKMFDVVSELNEELRGKLFVGNVTRGREVSKEMEGRFSSEFVYDDKYLHSFSFLGNEVKIPTYFDKHKELSFANFSLEEAVKKVTSDEFVTNLLFRREKDKVSKEKHALYSKAYEKEKELYQLDSQIKSLGTKIRFSLFNKKALSDQRIALLEQRTKVAEELAELRLAHAEKEAQEASLEGKYAKYIPTAEVKEALKNEFIKEYDMITSYFEKYNNLAAEKQELEGKSIDSEKLDRMRFNVRERNALAEKLCDILASNPENRNILDSIVNDENCNEEVRELAGLVTQMSEQKKVKKNNYI